MDVKVLEKSDSSFGRCDILSSPSLRRCKKDAVYMVSVKILNGEDEVICVCKNHLQFLKDSEFKGIVNF